MITSFLARLLAEYSEEFFKLLFNAMMREIVLNKKKEALAQAVEQIELAVKEIKESERDLNEDEIKKLIDAGRVAAQQLRERK